MTEQELISSYDDVTNSYAAILGSVIDYLHTIPKTDELRRVFIGIGATMSHIEAVLAEMRGVVLDIPPTPDHTDVTQDLLSQTQLS